MQFLIKNPRELEQVAMEIVRRAEAATNQQSQRAFICTLSGDLGAGKTTLTQAIARVLGVADNLQSPTFVIRKRYETSNPVITQLIHIDAYRLHSGVELERLKFREDMASPNTLICLEWPEQIADLGLAADCVVQLEHIDEETRAITLA